MARLLGPVGLGLLLIAAVELVVGQTVDEPLYPGPLIGAALTVAGPVGGPIVWWALVAVGLAVPVAAVVVLVRRLGGPAALRVVGVGAAIAALLLGGGRFADLLLSVGGSSLPVYGVGRWFLAPALAFAFPVLVARLIERRLAGRWGRA